ncbi:MAG: CDP-alcohol phosphatidyltransferase family protein [Clostridia bacterium]|nr:CDP-alcohol phosphatidyltransferase family protein [Clostridia bacterium]
MKNLANYVTLVRILFCLFLLFLYPFSDLFYAIYIVCGFTDIIDGFVARKFDIETDFGARFDSLADIVFVVVSAIKIIPSIFESIDIKLWMFAIFIAIAKLLSMGLVAIKHNTFGLIHSILNKMAGLSLFISPFFLNIMNRNMLVAIICLICSIAALEEVVMNLLHTDLDLNRRGLYIHKTRKIRRRKITKRDYERIRKKLDLPEVTVPMKKNY